MRIVVNGQQAFGASVLHALLERGDQVVAVYCAPQKPDRPIDPLREAAESVGVPVRQPASFKDPAAAAEMAELAPDLMVMAFVTLFVPEPVLHTPTHGSIQYHPSLLPRHRGPSAINWAIIQGERTTGVSVFWPDDGLDTGPVLLRREVAIEDDDTLGSLYFDKLFPLGVQAMMDAVDLVGAGDAPKEPQDEALATYEGWCRQEDVEVDWALPARRVYDLVRGADPRPGAWTTIDGEQVTLFGARLTGDGGSTGSPGQVVEVTRGEVLIALDGDVLAVREVRAGDGEKQSAAEHARRAALEPGTVLGRR